MENKIYEVTGIPKEKNGIWETVMIRAESKQHAINYYKRIVTFKTKEIQCVEVELCV